MLGQPPSYESVMEQDEDKSEDEISTLLHGQAENGSGSYFHSSTTNIIISLQKMSRFVIKQCLNYIILIILLL